MNRRLVWLFMLVALTVSLAGCNFDGDSSRNEPDQKQYEYCWGDCNGNDDSWALFLLLPFLFILFVILIIVVIVVAISRSGNQTVIIHTEDEDDEKK